MKKTFIYIATIALALNSWGADIQLGKGFTKELAEAKEANANAVLLKLVHPTRNKDFKSDVLDSKELNAFLGKRGIMVVEVDYSKDDRIYHNGYGGRSTARQVWNTGNCVGMVLIDLNGKVLNKLPNDQGHTGPFGKKVVFKISDIIKMYDELAPTEVIGVSLPLKSDK